MNAALFAAPAGFPPCWLEHDLLSGEFFDQQRAEWEAELRAGSGESDCTEHWRHAAFWYWLWTNPDAERLAILIGAALADPDAGMGGAALMDIMAHPNCTDALLRVAQDGVRSDSRFSASAEDLHAAFSRPDRRASARSARLSRTTQQ